MVDEVKTVSSTNTTSTSTSGVVEERDSSVIYDPKNTSWQDVGKQAIMSLVTKGGPIVLLLTIVLVGIGYLADKHLSSYFANQAVVTKTYVEFIEQAKASDEARSKLMAAVTASVAMNARRLDSQDEIMQSMKTLIDQNGRQIASDLELSRKMLDEGSRPVRGVVDMMNKAVVLMEPVPKLREESNKISSEILVTQKSILATIQQQKANP